LHAVDHAEDSDDELPARKRQKNDMMVQLIGEVKSIRDTLNTETHNNQTLETVAL